MKKLLFPLSLIGALTITSCSDDNTVFNEPSPFRSYETDANILAQFVDVDNVTGMYFINSNKKVTASDYVVNRSREDLMMVSSINRDLFTRDMESVNEILRAMKQSDNPPTIIYSTYTSDEVIEGRVNDFFEIRQTNTQSIGKNTLAQLTVTAENSHTCQLSLSEKVAMNVSAHSSSQFYLYQISLGNVSNTEAGSLYIAGVNTPCTNHSYALTNKSGYDWVTIKGTNLIGNGTLSVSFTR